MATEYLGYFGASLTVLSAGVSRMMWLRLLALGANVAMIGYAVGQELTPVLIQHATMLPLNLAYVISIMRQLRTQ